MDLVTLAIEVVLGRAVLGRTGSARARLLIAAIATAAFAIAILGVGAGQAADGTAEVAGTITRAIALLSAIGYAVAFLPPRSLRRTWQASTGFWATQDLLQLTPTTPVAEIWDWLAVTARRFSGSDAIVVLGAGPAGEVVELSDAEKARLNGNILGVVRKGATAETGLRDWLRRVAPAEEAAGPAGR